MAKKESEDENMAMREIERLAKEQVKRDAEDTKRIKGAEVKAKKEAGKLAKEQAKRGAAEAKQAKKGAGKQAKEQAKRAKKEPAPEVSSASYEGDLQLVLPSLLSFKQVQQFTDSLAGVEDLKIVWTGGSDDEGTIVAVSLARAMPLASIISEMPIVEGVEVKGGKITVILKAAA